MPGYTREQLDNIRRIKATPEYKAASPKERKSLFESTIVESSIRDLHHGDGSSQGILQQQDNGAWGAAKESVEKDVGQYLDVARQKNATGKYGSAGSLAQAVQGSAFPERYDQRSAEADKLVGASSDSNPYSVPTVSKGSAPTLNKGGSELDKQGAVTAALLDKRKGMSLTGRILDNVQSGKYTIETKPSVTPSKAPKYKVAAGTPTAPAAGSDEKGTAEFEGTKVAAWIEPALSYARKHGWKGQVNSGYRSLADQTRIYNSGVRPAAKPGTSNHEGSDFPRGAIDVSDAQQLSEILLASPYAKKLVFAGAKDPVHFSHPHGGSY